MEPQAGKYWTCPFVFVICPPPITRFCASAIAMVNYLFLCRPEIAVNIDSFDAASSTSKHINIKTNIFAHAPLLLLDDDLLSADDLLRLGHREQPPDFVQAGD